MDFVVLDDQFREIFTTQSFMCQENHKNKRELLRKEGTLKTGEMPSSYFPVQIVDVSGARGPLVLANPAIS
ncbi:MAG TPA: hypothetical protein DD706_14885 [Nitrospiraceae bacterium]|nr:hypothetical protein [Nitrospiraceae bacterium]